MEAHLVKLFCLPAGRMHGRMLCVHAPQLLDKADYLRHVSTWWFEMQPERKICEEAGMWLQLPAEPSAKENACALRLSSPAVQPYIRIGL